MYTPLGFAQRHFFLRMVIWGQSIYIVVPLVILILGHWAVLMQGITTLFFLAFPDTSEYRTSQALWSPLPGLEVLVLSHKLIPQC